MEKEQAINLLIEAVKVAQTHGAFDLPSAKLVAVAVETLSPASEPPKVEPEEKESKKSK